MNFSKFFSNIQEANWYRQFLNPVIENIEPNSKLLDIGTGSGKLLKILTQEKDVDCTGIDTSQSMLDEAKIKLSKFPNIKLLLIKSNEQLGFNDKSFNNVSICNVLFHLNDDSIDELLSESIRVLKENGKIIILTPSGKKGILHLIKNYLSFDNWGILVWYNATKGKAKEWTTNNYLQKYCKSNNLKYEKELTLNGYAQLEMIYK